MFNQSLFLMLVRRSMLLTFWKAQRGKHVERNKKKMQQKLLNFKEKKKLFFLFEWMEILMLTKALIG